MSLIRYRVVRLVLGVVRNGLIKYVKFGLMFMLYNFLNSIRVVACHRFAVIRRILLMFILFLVKFRKKLEISLVEVI